jgi:uncharacterized OB-fold protein
VTGKQSELPAELPETGPDTAAFWAAAAEGRLMLPRCEACGFVIWYPRRFCPQCHSTDVRWIEATGSGSVYSFTICRRGTGAYQRAAPYVLAYVELDEGPRVLTNIAGIEPESIRIGQRVTAVFDPVRSGAALVRFRPDTR